MAYNQLILPRNTKAQQYKLLADLTEWNVDLLEQILVSLANKDASVKLQLPTEDERIVSLKIVSQGERMLLLQSFNAEEQLLYQVLEHYKPHS